MTRPVLAFPSRRNIARLTAAAVASTATLAVAGTGSPAVSAPDGDCPAAYPSSALVRDQAVEGLTVSAGTTPDGFTGKVLGVLEDGIAPGLDMIMMRLTSPEIDRVGIWSGMSGSPVYAEDGRLIGAVAYGLSFGPSAVAGVTPAADMQELLAERPTGSLPDTATEVAIPRRVVDRLVEARVASRTELDEGFSQLALPFGMAGLPHRRLELVADKLDLDLEGMRMAQPGTTAVAPDDSVVAGGNIAAAISYGDITAAGVGTITAVCGEEVLGFGHPMLWTGPSALSMHAADALYVQEDPTFSGFKVANIDPTPIGTITQDRMAGIMGALGAAPATSDVTSTVSVGNRSRDGRTQVALADWMPDIAFAHILTNQDRVFDGIGSGTADVGWTINGTREDGSPFSFSYEDVHANEYDITFDSAWDVIEALYTLEYNGIEDITITSVDFDSELSRDYDHYVFKKAQIARDGRWRTLEGKRLFLEPGKRHKVRVTLESADHGILRTIKTLRVPRSVEGGRGVLTIMGGNGYYGDEFYYEEDYFSGGAPETKTFDDVLANLADTPHNDEVLIDLSFYNRRGRVMDERHRSYRTGMVVDGGTRFRVIAIG